MSRLRENGAAAEERALESEAGGAPDMAPPSDVALQSAIRSLVDLAGDVLRALHGVNVNSPVELRTALGERSEAAVDLGAAARAEQQLRVLRGLLQDHADGIDRASTSDRALAGVDVLRRLLESTLRTRVTLPGEEKRGADQPTAEEFDQALKDAVALVPPAGPEESETAPETEWIVSNLTARPLRLRGTDGITWVFPAYSDTTLDQDQKRLLDLRPQRARGEVKIKPRVLAAPTQYTFLAGLVWLLPVTFIVGKALEWPWWAWIASAVALVILALSVITLQKGERREHLWNIAGELPAVALQTLTYAVVVMIAVGLPAVAIIFGADLQSVVRDVVEGQATAAEYLTVVGRTMQVVFIAIASMLPGLLYFQFDRDRLSTLREKFVHQIFRLDPAMRTQGAIEAKYGQLIDEIYGPERSGRFRRLTRGRRAPIFVATLLIMLGWLYVLLNPEVGLTRSESETAELFVPRHTAVAFAFLGAYFFTLFALLRGYVRRDLRPKSYSDISVRIIAVAILAWVLELVFRDDSTNLLIFAFISGLVPQAALNRIRELAQGLPQLRRSTASGEEGDDGGDDVAAALDDPLPLTDIAGIDLYDRTRLASEGVTNIEALAHHDLVELMLQTRIPVPRLVDWTDQAILHLHVGAADRAKLHTYGIRTATDLIYAREQAEARGKLDPFLGILRGHGSGKPSRMQVIIDAMEDEEWMDSLRFWRRHGPAEGASAHKSSG